MKNDPRGLSHDPCHGSAPPVAPLRGTKSGLCLVSGRLGRARTIKRHNAAAARSRRPARQANARPPRRRLAFVHSSAMPDDPHPRQPAPLRTALALALSAAVSLGLARFSYALLLPPMRDDLGWSYFTAGAMNTVNAAGYLVGALLLPALLRRVDARAADAGRRLRHRAAAGAARAAAQRCVRCCVLRAAGRRGQRRRLRLRRPARGAAGAAAAGSASAGPGAGPVLRRHRPGHRRRRRCSCRRCAGAGGLRAWRPAIAGAGRGGASARAGTRRTRAPAVAAGCAGARARAVAWRPLRPRRWPATRCSAWATSAT